VCVEVLLLLLNVSVALVAVVVEAADTALKAAPL
jgi:hypothetical protein